MSSTRAEFLTAGAAALAVVALPGGGTRGFVMAAEERTSTLGDWLRMWPDGTVEVFTDKVEVGMGVTTGLGLLVADELDVPFSRIKMMLGDTDFTVSAGGVGGSNSTFMGNLPLRNAAATMRSILVKEASLRMNVPVDKLAVTDVLHGMIGESWNIDHGAFAHALRQLRDDHSPKRPVISRRSPPQSAVSKPRST